MVVVSVVVIVPVVVVELVGMFLGVAADEDDGHGHDDGHDEHAGEGAALLVAAVLGVAVFAAHHGFYHLQRRGEGAVVVAVAQRRNHLVVNDMLAEHVGQGALEAVACGDGHGTPVLFRGLALDEDDQAVVELVASHAPPLADALCHGILVVAVQGGDDDDGYLVRGGVVEGYQSLFQRLALVGGEDARVVVHQSVRLLGCPFRLCRSVQPQQRQCQQYGQPPHLS